MSRCSRRRISILDSDAVTFNIESEHVSLGDLKVELDFPYPPKHNVTKSFDFEIYMGMYEFPLNHTPTLVAEAEELQRGTARIYHEMDETTYFIHSPMAMCLAPITQAESTPMPEQTTTHRYAFSTSGACQYGPRAKMPSTAYFSLDQETPALPSIIRKHNTADWNQYWNEGSFVDLTESPNPAAEL